MSTDHILAADIKKALPTVVETNDNDNNNNIDQHANTTFTNKKKYSFITL